MTQAAPAARSVLALSAPLSQRRLSLSSKARSLRVAFYELSHPMLPNALVDISSVAEKKEEALAAFASQQAVTIALEDSAHAGVVDVLLDE